MSDVGWLRLALSEIDRAKRSLEDALSYLAHEPGTSARVELREALDEVTRSFETVDAEIRRRRQ